MPISHDYHTHTTYSDGAFPFQMIAAAEEAGLDGIGFTDHCNVSAQETLQNRRTRYGFNLDLTYERRRAGIENARGTTDVRLFDALEIDYHPADEERTRTFLEEAGFDYAIGSVHTVDGRDLAARAPFRAMDDDERSAVVDRYFERQCALIESELFEIVGHLDFLERNPPLRGYATRDQYARVASALVESRTVPEINVGRLLRSYGEAHPRPEFLDVLFEAGVEFVAGSDAHSPVELRDRTDAMAELFEGHSIEPLTILD